MRILKSLASAFLMYSRIPMPQVEWKEENRRYALCFFPLVGAVSGAIFLIWKYVCGLLDIGALVFAAVSVLIPLIVTGGIHIDGFCDVTDAKASCADREGKLKIMSDPHIGSFAAMWLCAYLILQTAMLAEIKNFGTAVIVACGFVLSRSLSGLAAVTFKSAKKEGALQSFAKPAHKKVTVAVLLVFTAVSVAAMLRADLISGGLALAGAAGAFIYYRISAYKNFGGITGDLAGWFLQICEMAVMIFAVAGEKLTEAFL
ncbi:MAG: adenosylcobinamide-GDP ribazoletransferase [Oscillospiraceae bacterium]